MYMIMCTVLQIYQENVVYLQTCEQSDTLQLSFPSYRQVSKENRLRGQEPMTRRKKIILSGRSSGETGTQEFRLYMEMNDNHVCRLLHSHQLQSSFPQSSDAKKNLIKAFSKTVFTTANGEMFMCGQSQLEHLFANDNSNITQD